MAPSFHSTVKPGDTVLFGKYSGQEITVDGSDYLIMKEDDVLGIVETATQKQASKRTQKR